MAGEILLLLLLLFCTPYKDEKRNTIVITIWSVTSIEKKKKIKTFVLQKNKIKKSKVFTKERRQHKNTSS